MIAAASRCRGLATGKHTESTPLATGKLGHVPQHVKAASLCTFSYDCEDFFFFLQTIRTTHLLSCSWAGSVQPFQVLSGKPSISCLHGADEKDWFTSPSVVLFLSIL